MFNVRSAALTAALYGLHAASPANAAGCYPAYASTGTTYAAGSMVSITKTTTTLVTYEQCFNPGVGDCPTSGQRVIPAVSTTTTRNYECKSGVVAAHCNNAGYAPGGWYSGSAWNDKGACTGTPGTASAAIPAASIPTAWSGGGCPGVYSGGTSYDPMDVVSVAMAGYNMVYKCAGAPTNQYCGQAGYAPGVDQYWTQAWTSLGSCTGTIAPTDSPVYVSLPNAGGCPSPFSSSESYGEGDRVSKGDLVYQCKTGPASGWCSMVGYEPATGEGATEYWKQAWTVTGYCSGTITPTSSPNYVSLVDMGGCPDAWEIKAVGNFYEEGDMVSSMGLVYACNAWPYSGNCGQAGFEPNTDPATPDAWKLAWTVKGYCSGSIGPTASPNFDPSVKGQACPGDWERGSNVKYAEGDMVAVVVSAQPLRKVAFKCKGWPLSGHCGQYAPDHSTGGSLGWTIVGSCDGSIGPTMSPSFDSLNVMVGCPREWTASTTDFEAGDKVAYTVSTTPLRQVVYECRSWPNSGYCNQGAGFEPGTQYSGMAWTLKGACDGSLQPTSSPIEYVGTCEFNKCVKTTSCTPGAGIVAGSTAGSTACSCAAGDTAGTSCVQTTCTDIAVNKYSSTADYDYGDVVRISSQRYKCKGYAEGLWCKQEAYKPTTESSGTWTLAWTLDGTCTPQAAPTPSSTPAGLPPCVGGCACQTDDCVPGTGIDPAWFEGSEVCSCEDPNETQTANCQQKICQ